MDKVFYNNSIIISSNSTIKIIDKVFYNNNYDSNIHEYHVVLKNNKTEYFL